MLTRHEKDLILRAAEEGRVSYEGGPTWGKGELW